MLTTYNEDEWIFNAIQTGASGYLLKDTAREEIVRAIRGTMAGKPFINPEVVGKSFHQLSSRKVQSVTTLTENPTEREVDVL